ncbi:hypothetical protein PhaeoP83_01744 [Phaeobacter inhibens]|uniref:Pam3-gp28 family putative phage holin n=1 Tax=Phaeobacter inhibens TaxID=221822 RepID=UPI00076BB4EA|nr:hypothetical protein [Phaeobacter inhibens]AUQ50017.1 hypothetical protein PhaeoP83_01744 [Phaeobacter inhibens]AUQ54255.1 hypothetical protein PhaeoP92_01574 [Phaeobacter inhibens]AUQ78271.1 hypothetical protein PhaeoP74_01575 [Phaeobacter inhibens]AUR15430.1 hypothetical protein PhaeoP70_01573 [Phaeobacter inhibens]AUR19822.1 hypothetical protein PhaeoP80_01744 [Phaeobacter inhibens]
MKNIFFSSFLGPMIRHGATVLGGYLVAEGMADADTAQQIVGGLTAAGGVGLSYLEKRLRF